MTYENLQRNLYKGTYVIGEHTIAELPKAGDKILDVGCRAYSFAKRMARLGCDVFAVEPDEKVNEHKNPRIHLIRAALVPSSMSGKELELITWSTGEGNHLRYIKGSIPINHGVQIVKGYSIEKICEITGVDKWEIVKLDCEGSEYGILLDWPGPIARQITVEFHDFTGANPEGEKMYEKIFEHLSPWYEIIKHKKTELNGILNYWDSLFVLKDNLIND